MRDYLKEMEKLCTTNNKVYCYLKVKKIAIAKIPDTIPLSSNEKLYTFARSCGELYCKRNYILRTSCLKHANFNYDNNENQNIFTFFNYR